MQPPSSQRRFKHDLEELRRSLADRFADEIYLGMDKYDLGAVCFDWDSEAVERLRSLCKDFGAGIVISSDWRRSKSTRGLQALFRVYELHHYVTDATNESGGPPLYRAGEVKEYLESHPEIERFVIIDDGFRKEFEELFPEQFVRTWFRLEADNEQRARQILSGLPAQPKPGVSASDRAFATRAVRRVKGTNPDLHASQHPPGRTAGSSKPRTMRRKIIGTGETSTCSRSNIGEVMVPSFKAVVWP